MGEITMSAKELLFAGAQLGASRFYGLPDPFYGMTPAQIYNEIPKLQSALEQRGFAQCGFDGTFALKDEVKALVIPCVQCRQYLLTRCTNCNGAQQLAFIYFDANSAVEVECCGDEVTLRSLAGTDAAQRVQSRFARSGAEAGEACSITLQRQALASAQAQAIDTPQKAKQALLAEGCTDQTAALLVQGFRHEANFYMLIRADLKQRTLSHAMAVEGEEGTIWLTLADQNEELWQLEFLPDGVDFARISALCMGEGEANELL